MSNKVDNFKINDIDTDFIERMLKSLPSNIYLKDTESRYVICTHYWNHIECGDDPDWTIKGKTDLDIRKDKVNALKAMEEDKKILATGEGSSYEIMENCDGKKEYFQVIKNPVFDKQGNIVGIVGLINNITETKLLEQKLDKLATTDILTGLKNRAYLPIWIEKHKGEDILPMAVFVSDDNDLKKVNDRYGHAVGDEYIKGTARVLKQNLPGPGCVMRSGGDEFITLIPNCDKSGCEAYIKAVKEQIGNLGINDFPFTISMGYSICMQKDFRIEDYIGTADEMMYAEKSEYHK